MAAALSFFKPSGIFFHRRMLIRASLFLNFCVLTYVALQAAQNTGGNVSGTNGVGSGVASFSDNFNLPSGVQIIYNNAEGDSAKENSASTNAILSSVPAQLSTEMDIETSSMPVAEQQHPASSPAPETTDSSRLVDLNIKCQDNEKRFSYSQRGSYWILNNYIPSEQTYHCNESISYTTHGDVTFLDNIIPLSQKWDGPLSVTVYTPGTDYETAIHHIAYLRQCTGSEIRQKVTFHFVLDERHFPANVRKFHPQQGLLAVYSSNEHIGSLSSASTPTPDNAQRKQIVMVSVSGISVYCSISRM